MRKIEYNKIVPMGTILKDYLKLPFQFAWKSALALLIIRLLSGVLPALQAVFSAIFIDEALFLVRNSYMSGALWIGVTGLLICIFISKNIEPVCSLINGRMKLDIQKKCKEKLIQKRAELPYSYIENQETWNQIARISKNPEKQFFQAYSNLMSLAALIIQIAGIELILYTKSWKTAVFVIILLIPVFILAVVSGRKSYQIKIETTRLEREYEVLSQIITGRESTEERKLFQYGYILNQEYLNSYFNVWKKKISVMARYEVRNSIGALMISGMSSLIIFVLLMSVIEGKITAGLFISLCNAFIQLIRVVSRKLAKLMDSLAAHYMYLEDWEKLFLLPSDTEYLSKPSKKIMVMNSLEFRNVTFSYPETEKQVLKRCSFTIEAGKKYAFVGENGSGKTTITKLLDGLYEEYEGEILLNGESIRNLSIPERKALFAVIYQDFARYQIPLGDNVILGDSNHMLKEDQEIEDILKDQGLSETIQKLAEGIHTPLGKIQENGMDLSGGEWQKIAMARLQVSNAPVQILDEPTAALDPISESQIYKQYATTSKNRTTILISHRLGAVVDSDWIFVLHDGHIKEQGNHKSLLDQKGLYTKMYESQKGWYV